MADGSDVLVIADVRLCMTQSSKNPPWKICSQPGIPASMIITTQIKGVNNNKGWRKAQRPGRCRTEGSKLCAMEPISHSVCAGRSRDQTMTKGLNQVPTAVM